MKNRKENYDKWDREAEEKWQFFRANKFGPLEALEKDWGLDSRRRVKAMLERLKHFNFTDIPHEGIAIFEL